LAGIIQVNKNYIMTKNIFISLLTLFSGYYVYSQNVNIDILENLENQQTTTRTNQPAITATLKSATRLFADKDDLTSVIFIIPSGSEVEVLGADSTYLRVVYEEAEGFILKRHAAIKQTPFSSRTPPQSHEYTAAESSPIIQSQPYKQGRFAYLENKYGTSIASKLIAGKIWKGISADMVRDSWGSPLKINRVISGNLVREEWTYKNSWLYIENDILMTWGPVEK